MIKTNNKKKLINTSIKSREVTYYLVTEQDLNDVKSKGILGDIFMGLESIVFGGLISITLIKLTEVGLNIKIMAIIDVTLYVFLALALLFGIFTFIFTYQSFSSINRIKHSGEIKSYDIPKKQIKSHNPKGNNKVNTEQILFAIYYTDKKQLDITREIREMFQKKQEIIASNQIAGDPDYGTVKKLMIRYLFKGITIEKIFNEGEKVIIP